jgi:hypothetical protein
MVLLEVIPVISLQSVPGSNPDETEGVPHNTCAYTLRSETLKGLKVEDGEEFFLCEERMKTQNKKGQCLYA